MNFIKKISHNRIYSFSPERFSAAFFFNLSYFTAFIGYSIWGITFHNYAIETFHVDKLQVGKIFSLTAIPGVLAFSMGFIAKEVRIILLLTASSILIGLGLFWISLVSSWNMIWPGVLIISAGFTCFYTVINSLTLLESQQKTSALLLGSLKSFGPLSAIISAFLVFYLSKKLGYKPFFMITGIVVLLCGGITTFIVHKKQYAVIHSKFSFNKKRWPYYILNFLAGCRSSLFKTFVLYLLIDEYDLEIKGTALLNLAGSFIAFIGYRLTGQLSATHLRRDNFEIDIIPKC